MRYRPFQQEQDDGIHAGWASGARNMLLVSPTGSGKTVVGSGIIKKNRGPSCAIAHRQELVSQISIAFARNGIRHKLISPKKVVKMVSRLHMEELGAVYLHPEASCAVAGVDTLVRRGPELSHWLNSVTLWWQDEAHHVLEKNKWGKAAAMFPNARGLGVTATPTRADGRGLGRHADGLFDDMVIVDGADMRGLINQGYLTDYRIFAPPSDLDLSTVDTVADGDYSKPKLKAAVRKSQIVGDVVKHYLRIAPGKLGITFATDVETATDIAAQFNAAGVPAAVVSADTPTEERVSILRRFKNRELMQLVNVDLFGEGFDLPAIEVVSMARPTQSYALFVQQFGRALRLMISPLLAAAWDTYTDAQRCQFIADSSKPYAIIIDHVGNVGTLEHPRHGLPDAPKLWTLDRRDRTSRTQPTDAIPTRTCLNPATPACLFVYERIHTACPLCGYGPIPAIRSGPEFVDGDLAELDAATLARMRGEAVDLEKTPVEYLAESGAGNLPHVAAMAAAKRHTQKQEAQKALRDSIALWGGWQRAQNRPDSESYRRFYFRFGIDVLSAQALGRAEAEILTARVNEHLQGAKI